jgi:hypothetical protein
VVINLLNAHGDEAIIRRVIEDASATLADWLERFKKDVGSIDANKTEMGIVSLFALFGIPHLWLAAVAKLVPPLFKLRELKRPWWKTVASKPWAPAGIVYEASRQ